MSGRDAEHAAKMALQPRCVSQPVPCTECLVSSKAAISENCRCPSELVKDAKVERHAPVTVTLVPLHAGCSSHECSKADYCLTHLGLVTVTKEMCKSLE